MQTILHSLARTFTRQKNRTRFLSLLLAMAMLPLTGLGSPTVSADVSSGAVQHGPAAEMRQVGTTTLDVVTPNVTFKQGDGEVLVAPNLNLNGPANGTLDKVTVTLDNGFVGNQDALSLPANADTGGITWKYDNTTGILALTGQADFATYQRVLRQVSYSNNSGTPTTSDRTVSISLGSSLFYPDNGHFYEFVEVKPITWSDAKVAAEGRNYYGLQGYLVTVTSEGENEFIKGKLQGQGWMGASDSGHDRKWYWVTGPEAGTWFFTQNGYNPSGDNGCDVGASTTQPPGNYYSKWNAGEPNDFGPNKTPCADNEDYGHFLKDGNWNDYAENDSRIDGYVVEYGGMATDPKLSLKGEVTIKWATPPFPNSHGEVHIFTPDGLIYDFQIAGELLAVQSSDKKVIVQARQEPWEQKSGVTINTAVAFSVDGDKLEFYLKPESSFYLNNELTDLPSSRLALPNGGSIDPLFANESRHEYIINWPDGSFTARLIIYSNSYMDYGVARQQDSQTYAGLLGNLDGNAQNDLQIRDGDQIKPPASIADLNRFADSWRLSAEESLFRDAEGTATHSAQPFTMQDIEAEQRAQAEETCQTAGISDPFALRNCTYDVAVTDDEIFVESAKVLEESTKDLPPSAKVPAQPGETLGGAIFDADQADAENITIMDGDDLIVTTGKSADGTGYLRFNIYRNGAYVVSYSVNTDAEVADALVEAMAATQEVAEEESGILEEDSTQLQEAAPICLEGLTILSDNMYEYPAEVGEWTDVYTVFTEEFLPACDYIGAFLSTYAGDPALADIEDRFAELGIGSWANLFTEVAPGSVLGITFHGSRIIQYCPAAHLGQYDCVQGPERILNSIEAIFFLLQ